MLSGLTSINSDFDQWHVRKQGLKTTHSWIVEERIVERSTCFDIIRWNNYLNKNGDPKLRGKLVPKMSPGTFLLVPIYFSGTFLVVPKSFKRLVMGPVWWSLLQWFPSEVEHSSTKINWIPVLLKFLIDTNNLDLFVIRKLIFFFIKKRIT
jgi:hypothetical protein